MYFHHPRWTKSGIEGLMKWFLVSDICSCSVMIINLQFGGWVESMNQPSCAKALQCGRCLVSFIGYPTQKDLAYGESWNFDPTEQWRCTTTPDWWQESLCHWRSYWWSRGHIMWVVWEMVMGHDACNTDPPMAQRLWLKNVGQMDKLGQVVLLWFPDGVTGPVRSPSSFERFKVEREAIRSRNKSCMLPEILSSGFRIKIPPSWREHVMKQDFRKGGSFAWSTSVGLPFQNQ